MPPEEKISVKRAPEEPRKRKEGIGSVVSREEFLNLSAKVDSLAGMTRELLLGFKEKMAPRIDALETSIATLPDQLTQSFKVQGEAFKKYVDEKVPAPAAQPQGINGFIGFIGKQIQDAGGLQKLLGGLGTANTGQPTSDLFLDLYKEAHRQFDSKVFIPNLRKAAGFAPEGSMTAEAGAGPATLTHG